MAKPKFNITGLSIADLIAIYNKCLETAYAIEEMEKDFQGGTDKAMECIQENNDLADAAIEAYYMRLEQCGIDTKLIRPKFNEVTDININ